MVLLMRETSGARDVGRRFVVLGIGLGGAQMTDAAAPGPPEDGSDEVHETETETERRRAAGDDVLLDALAAGLSYVEAGALAGVSARTARRRLTDHDFASHLARRRAARVSDVTGRLTVGSERAVQVLLDALDSEVGGERLRAAELVLNMGRRFRGDSDVDLRLSTLEAGRLPAPAEDVDEEAS